MKLEVQLSVEGTEIRNRWDLWVFPSDEAVAPPANVTVAADWSADIALRLERGETVLLTPSGGFGPDSRPGCFTTMFWNPIHKPDQPAKTLGILCDPAHPVFQEFPTESHTNWQWWELLMPSWVMNVTALAPRLNPLVQPIDTYTQNEKLAMLFECRVGPGRLLVCSIDLQTHLDCRPVARQFLRSVHRYMVSESFQPAVELTTRQLEAFFRNGQELKGKRRLKPATKRE